MITRRLALFRIGASSAVATVAATPLLQQELEARTENRELFKHPAEYLAAMEAIGWRATAMFRHLKDGRIHRMGVNERGPSREAIERTWPSFHAIQLRSPVQLPFDAHPGGWWREVWQFLYDRGLREDVGINAEGTHEERG